MKLLSSDYDLTLNCFDYDLRLNLLALKKFRMNNNIFLLNTGRPYNSIKSEIDNHKIAYDYLSCCDGNLLLNSDDKVIFATNLSDEILKDLQLLSEEFPMIDVRPILYNGNILEYEVRFPSKDKKLYMALVKLCSKYNLCVKDFSTYSLDGLNLRRNAVYYLCDKNVSKATSTQLVANIENIDKSSIWTIGDHHNDVEMVKEFNGWTLPWGKKTVKEVSDGVCLSVASLVKKISR